MTAVASPPSLQPLPRLGWNSGNSAQGGLNSMSADEVTRMFMPRKSAQRSNSSSSIASSASSSSTSSSTSTVTAPAPQTNGASPIMNGDQGGWGPRKKPARGLWPSSKAEPVSGVSNARLQSISTPSSGQSAASVISAIHQPSPVLPSQSALQSTQQQNGSRTAAASSQTETPALLVLLPMNGTFERKQITVPFSPEVLRIGRQTNAKTVPTPINGFFDSKVLSRQHAEVWADRSNGKIWIRDVKSSNGTFVNGMRLSQENRDSEPHELREQDVLELGIDIVSEDQKSIVHHKVSAKVEHAGIHNSGTSVLDLNFGDIDPSSGGIAFPQHMPQMRGRVGSQGSISSNGRMSGPASVAGSNMSVLGHQRQMNSWLNPITIEQVVKRLGNELKQAKQQSLNLHRTGDFFDTLLTQEPGEAILKSQATDPTKEPQTNGIPLPLKSDPMSPFSQPPAPPPQQPLPEKPDVARFNIPDSAVVSPVKRTESERPRSGVISPSKSDPPPSQILSLVEALSNAKREIDSQGDRVKHLEILLKQEREAREGAEERARRLLEGRQQGKSDDEIRDIEADLNPRTDITGKLLTPKSNGYEANDGDSRPAAESPQLMFQESKSTNGSRHDLQHADASTTRLQEKLDLMVKEMDDMKLQMEKYKRRTESAENERNTLAEMVEGIRAAEANALPSSFFSQPTNLLDAADAPRTIPSAHTNNDKAINLRTGLPTTNHVFSHSNSNGKPVDSSKPDVQALERVISGALAQSNRSSSNDRLVQSAPYASLLGVVLIGVGIMTYLNGWQKGER